MIMIAIVLLAALFALGFGLGLYFTLKKNNCTLSAGEVAASAFLAAIVADVIALLVGNVCIAGVAGILAPIVLFLYYGLLLFIAGYLLGCWVGEVFGSPRSASARVQYRGEKWPSPSPDIRHELCPVYA